MDVELDLTCPWDSEDIPDESYVYRHVHFRHITDKKPRIPRESHFILRENEDGLSVNWDKYCDENTTLVINSLTQHRSGNGFPKCSDYLVFKFFVKIIRKIDGIENVKHKPVFNGNPAPFGKPNNRAHSIILYQNDEEVRMKLCAYCNEHFDSSNCKLEIKSLEAEVSSLLARLNNTPFHHL